MNPQLLKRLILSSALIIIVIVIAYFGFKKFGKESYTEPKIGMSFSHSSNFTLVTQEGVGDVNQTTILWLYSNKGRILIVPSVLPIADVEKEKKFYETTLFGNPEQVSNTHEAFGEYVGFKSVVGFDHLFYTLYRPRTATSTLILRTEIIASSTEDGVGLDKELHSIFESLTFTSRK